MIDGMSVATSSRKSTPEPTLGFVMEKETVNRRRLVSFADLKPRFGISYTRRYLLTLENQRKFPARVPVGDHRVAWVESEVQAWIDRKVEEARQ